MTGHGAGRDYVVTEIPVELLFTELDVRSARTDHLIKSFTDRWYEHHLQYADISIMRLVPHRELYRYFAGEPGAAPDAYLDWYEQIHATRGITPPMSRKGLLIQRRMEYENMQSELSSGSGFFSIIRSKRNGIRPDISTYWTDITGLVFCTALAFGGFRSESRCRIIRSGFTPRQWLTSSKR